MNPIERLLGFRPKFWLMLVLLASPISSPKGAAAAQASLSVTNAQTLFAVLERAPSGVTVNLPPGTFELPESLRLRSGVKLLGAGQEATTLIFTGLKSVPFINLTDCEDVEIAHLTTDGRGRPLGQDGVRAHNSRRLFLHHLTNRNLANRP